MKTHIKFNLCGSKVMVFIKPFSDENGDRFKITTLLRYRFVSPLKSGRSGFTCNPVRRAYVFIDGGTSTEAVAALIVELLVDEMGFGLSEKGQFGDRPDLIREVYWQLTKNTRLPRYCVCDYCGDIGSSVVDGRPGKYCPSCKDEWQTHWDGVRATVEADRIKHLCPQCKTNQRAINMHVCWGCSDENDERELKALEEAAKQAAGS